MELFPPDSETTTDEEKSNSFKFYLRPSLNLRGNQLFPAFPIREIRAVRDKKISEVSNFCEDFR
jgi:hypothetical protein